MRERTRLAAQVDAVKSLETDLADAVGYAELADEEGDEGSLEEARAQLKALKERAGRAELEALLAGEADGNDAYVEINSGAGGTESNDWAGMLLRMYTRWAQAHGMTVEVIEETPGEQAGIKSITLQVQVPIWSSGGTHSRVKQSEYRWQAAKQRVERTSRETERLARDAYLGVMSEISRVQALQQALGTQDCRLA